VSVERILEYVQSVQKEEGVVLTEEKEDYDNEGRERDWPSQGKITFVVN